MQKDAEMALQYRAGTLTYKVDKEHELVPGTDYRVVQRGALARHVLALLAALTDLEERAETMRRWLRLISGGVGVDYSEYKGPPVVAYETLREWAQNALDESCPSDVSSGPGTDADSGEGRKPGSETKDAHVATEGQARSLREALLALVDVQPYLYPNPNAPNGDRWEEQRQKALDLAADALGGDGKSADAQASVLKKQLEQAEERERKLSLVLAFHKVVETKYTEVARAKPISLAKVFDAQGRLWKGDIPEGASIITVSVEPALATSPSEPGGTR